MSPSSLYPQEYNDFNQNEKLVSDQSFLQMISCQPPVTAHDLSGISLLPVTQNVIPITRHSSYAFYHSIRQFISVRSNSDYYLSLSVTEQKDYFRNFTLHCDYSFSPQLVEQRIAIGYSTGVDTFDQNSNTTMFGCSSASGLLGAIVELTESVVMFHLIHKIGDAAFASGLSVAQMPTILVPQHYLQYANDINSSSSVMKMKTRGSTGMISSNISIQSTMSQSSGSSSLFYSEFPDRIAAWCSTYLSLPYDDIKRVVQNIIDPDLPLESAEDYYGTEVSPALSMLRLMHRYVNVEELTSDDPQKVCNALASYSTFQRSWCSANAIMGHYECTPYEFINFKSQCFSTHPLMFGTFCIDDGAALVPRFKKPNKVEHCYWLMYVPTFSLSSCTDVVQEYITWRYARQQMSYTSRVVGTESFGYELVSAHHGNDAALEWPVSYDEITYDNLEIVSIDESAPNSNKKQQDIAACCFTGKRVIICRHCRILKRLRSNMAVSECITSTNGDTNHRCKTQSGNLNINCNIKRSSDSLSKKFAGGQNFIRFSCRNSSNVKRNSLNDDRYYRIPAYSRRNNIEYKLVLEQYDTERDYYFSIDDGEYVNDYDFVYRGITEWKIASTPRNVTGALDNFIWYMHENCFGVINHRTKFLIGTQCRLVYVKSSIRSSAFESLLNIAVYDSFMIGFPISFHCEHYVVTNVYNGNQYKSKLGCENNRLEEFMADNIRNLVESETPEVNGTAVIFAISVQLRTTLKFANEAEFQEALNIKNATLEEDCSAGMPWTTEVLPIGFIVVYPNRTALLS